VAARTVGGTESGIRRPGVVPTTAFLVLLEQLAPTERAVFLLREVFELDFDEIARSVGKSEANTRQILARARPAARCAPALHRVAS
jgi:RNA polymerase sigma-70 factor (ECF subfamily)